MGSYSLFCKLFWRWEIVCVATFSIVIYIITHILFLILFLKTRYWSTSEAWSESGEEKTSRHPWETDELWLLNYDNMKFEVIKMETEEDSPVIINDEYPEWDSENVCDIAEVFGNNEDHDEVNMKKKIGKLLLDVGREK